MGLELFRIQRELSEMFGVRVELGTELDSQIAERVRREGKVLVSE